MSSDFSSNTYWLMVYGMIILAAFSILGHWLTEVTLFDRISIYLIYMSHIVIFGAALEFFNLSPHHSKKSLFFVGILILWIFIPLFGYVTMPLVKYSENYIHYFLAPSPFFGLVKPVWMTIIDGPSDSDIKVRTITLTINLALAGVFILFAKRERQRLFKQIFESSLSKSS